MPEQAGPAGIDPLDLVEPERYARRGYPHDAWTRLRAQAPVAHFAPPGYRPFWAITKHADIAAISSQPLRFSSACGLMLGPFEAVPVPADMIVTLDPPRHRPMRRLATPHFTPRAVRAKRARIEAIAAEILDGVATGEETAECDFVERVAGALPLAVVAWILGVPRNDWPLLFRWTNEVIGASDPEFRRPGETPVETGARARQEMYAYFEDLITRRRSDPEDDLVSALLAARVDGVPLTPTELHVYCELVVEAGNETTRNAISGGLLAFSQFRGEWEKLRRQPERLPGAVEEILRWVTPIAHFTRVATEDCGLRGQPIRAGDELALFYASANRDEEVFEAPFEFRIDRRPNRHLSFGIGEHVCLGAHLARVEIETVFRHLVARLEEFELAGPVERLGSAVNGSIKRLPIRYRLA